MSDFEIIYLNLITIKLNKLTFLKLAKVMRIFKRDSLIFNLHIII